MVNPEQVGEITQWYSAFLVVGDIPRARGRLPHLPGLPMSFGAATVCPPSLI